VGHALSLLGAVALVGSHLPATPTGVSHPPLHSFSDLQIDLTKRFKKQQSLENIQEQKSKVQH